MNQPRRYQFSPRAERDFRKVDLPTRRRVIDALERWVAERPLGDVRKLRGSGDEWRLRIGDWRVRFTYDDDDRRLLLVLRVLPRNTAYRD